MGKTNNFIFTGMPGSGKTYITGRIADLLGLPFLDLDAYVEQRTGHTIPELFLEGERHFRQIEQTCLIEILTEQPAPYCLATGGGTICYRDNLERVRAAGVLVYIQANLETLIHRNMQARGSRPLLNTESRQRVETKLRELLLQREPFYRQSHLYYPSESESLLTFAERLKHYLPA